MCIAYVLGRALTKGAAHVENVTATSSESFAILLANMQVVDEASR